LINKSKSIIQSKSQIILASSSEARRKMLNDTGLIFKQYKSDIDEKAIKKNYKDINLDHLAKKLAESKALYVSNLKRKAYVIGADQICVKQSKVYSKPEFKKKAIEQLLELNGKTHKQISAVSVSYNNKIIWSHVEEVKIKMRKLSSQVLKNYVDLDLPLKSCGAYKFEANGKYLFSKIEGNTSTIIGLPLFPLLNFLYKKNIIAYV